MRESRKIQRGFATWPSHPISKEHTRNWVSISQCSDLFGTLGKCLLWSFILAFMVWECFSLSVDTFPWGGHRVVWATWPFLSLCSFLSWCEMLFCRKGEEQAHGGWILRFNSSWKELCHVLFARHSHFQRKGTVLEAGLTVVLFSPGWIVISCLGANLWDIKPRNEIEIEQGHPPGLEYLGLWTLS